MTAIVFLGPSLPLAAARAALDAVYLPPAGHGDVYRATLRRPRPRAIGLIDGYFRHRPAVRHKEILWAMSQGIHVFGAASIGALRAAELAAFGMVGIGRIFADFRDGGLEDDDEVAVDHGPAELGYPPLNEAMVDIRATLGEARRQGVIVEEGEARLLALAKQRFYPERSYEGLLAAGHQLAAEELDRLRAWLPAGRVSRKSLDAQALLSALGAFLALDPPPLSVAYRFERTETWDADVAFAAPLGSAEDNQTGEAEGTPRRDHLLDELRLEPETAQALRNEAMGLALARREAERGRIALSAAEVASFRTSWLAAQDLRDGAGLAAWRRANHLEGEAFEDFIAARARDARIAALARDLIDGCLADALRARGAYAATAARALAKQRALAAAGAGEISLAESGISAFDLLTWFCRERLQRPLPGDVEQLAADLAFASAEALYRALLREYLYLQLTNENAAAEVK